LLHASWTRVVPSHSFQAASDTCLAFSKRFLRFSSLSVFRCLLQALHSHSRHHDLPSPNPESTNRCSIGGSNVGHHNRPSQVCPCIRFLSVSHRRFKLQTRYLITYSNSTHRKNHHDTISFLLIGNWTLFHGTEPRSNQRTLAFAIVFYCITITASFFLSPLFECNTFNWWFLSFLVPSVSFSFGSLGHLLPPLCTTPSRGHDVIFIHHLLLSISLSVYPYLFFSTLFCMSSSRMYCNALSSQRTSICQAFSIIVAFMHLHLISALSRRVAFASFSCNLYIPFIVGPIPHRAFFVTLCPRNFEAHTNSFLSFQCSLSTPSLSRVPSVLCGAFQTVYHLTLHSIGLQVVVMRTRFKFVTIIVQYKEKSNESCTSFYYVLEGSSTCRNGYGPLANISANDIGWFAA